MMIEFRPSNFEGFSADALIRLPAAPGEFAIVYAGEPSIRASLGDAIMAWSRLASTHQHRGVNAILWDSILPTPPVPPGYRTQESSRWRCWRLFQDTDKPVSLAATVREKRAIFRYAISLRHFAYGIELAGEELIHLHLTPPFFRMLTVGECIVIRTATGKIRGQYPLDRRSSAMSGQDCFTWGGTNDFRCISALARSVIRYRLDLTAIREHGKWPHPFPSLYIGQWGELLVPFLFHMKQEYQEVFTAIKTLFLNRLGGVKGFDIQLDRYGLWFTLERKNGQTYSLADLPDPALLLLAYCCIAVNPAAPQLIILEDPLPGYEDDEWQTAFYSTIAGRSQLIVITSQADGALLRQKRPTHSLWDPLGLRLGQKAATSPEVCCPPAMTDDGIAIIRH